MQHTLQQFNDLPMSEYRKADFDGLFFITFTVVGWVDIFSRREYADLVIKNLHFCQQQKGLELFAYVIMTNHLHLLASQQDGWLQHLLGRFKSFSAKEILRAVEDHPKESRKDWLLHLFRFHARYKQNFDEYHFWQETNHPTFIKNPSMLRQKINYVHMNPVRAGYVLEPQHWYYSSACPLSPLKVLDV